MGREGSATYTRNQLVPSAAAKAPQRPSATPALGARLETSTAASTAAVKATTAPPKQQPAVAARQYPTTPELVSAMLKGRSHSEGKPQTQPRRPSMSRTQQIFQQMQAEAGQTPGLGQLPSPSLSPTQARPHIFAQIQARVRLQAQAILKNQPSAHPKVQAQMRADLEEKLVAQAMFELQARAVVRPRAKSDAQISAEAQSQLAIKVAQAKCDAAQVRLRDAERRLEMAKGLASGVEWGERPTEAEEAQVALRDGSLGLALSLPQLRASARSVPQPQAPAESQPQRLEQQQKRAQAQSPLLQVAFPAESMAAAVAIAGSHNLRPTVALPYPSPRLSVNALAAKEASPSPSPLLGAGARAEPGVKTGAEGGVTAGGTVLAVLGGSA
ncbi:hypothetical protein VTI74DRAFT_7705 [Chaetomium olivicolor]